MTQPDLATLDEQQLDAVMRALDAEDVTDAGRTFDLGASALYYASRGWPVFPLKVNGKTPLTRNGFKDATTDADTIRAWWAATPEANIGTPTGPLEQGGCGFDVLDIDGPAGYASLARIEHRRCPPGCSVEEFCPARLEGVVAKAYTGGGGRHLYLPALGTRRNSTSQLGAGIDVRAAGGYVVLAPSTHVSGRRYKWLERPVGV